MNLLILQETDWIKRGIHQQHHLMDRMALRGHKIHVIDYDYLWKDDKDKNKTIITGCILSLNPVIEPRVAQWT